MQPRFYKAYQVIWQAHTPHTLDQKWHIHEIVYENYGCPDFGQMIVTKLQSISNQWRCGGLLEYLRYDPILIIFGVILKLCNSTQF